MALEESITIQGMPPEKMLQSFRQMTNFQTMRTYKELWSNSKEHLEEIFRILKVPFLDSDISISYEEDENKFRIDYQNIYQGLFKERLEFITVIGKLPSEERIGSFKMSPPRDYETFRPLPLIYRAP